MSELTISSTNWLAISLRNGAAIIFNLNNTQQWQYLKPITNNETTPTATVSKQQVEDDDDNTSDLNRNLIKFTPDGQKLAINGQNKQIYIYIPSDYELNKTYWELQRIITVNKRASALDLTNEFLLIADKSGDVYKTNLSINTNLILTSDDCIMGHLSMLLDIAFIRTNENQQFILTADRDEKIRLSHYPNAYNIQGYCLGHTEFVSHVKLINPNHILSASGDGSYFFSSGTKKSFVFQAHFVFGIYLIVFNLMYFNPNYFYQLLNKYSMVYHPMMDLQEIL
jgi:WD40 repeat protein